LLKAFPQIKPHSRSIHWPLAPRFMIYARTGTRSSSSLKSCSVTVCLARFRVPHAAPFFFWLALAPPFWRPAASYSRARREEASVLRFALFLRPWPCAPLLCQDRLSASFTGDVFSHASFVSCSAFLLWRAIALSSWSHQRVRASCRWSGAIDES